MNQLSERAGGALLALGVLAATSAWAQSTAEANAARYVAANCANCHGTQGRSAGAMPSLAGQQKTYLAEQMRAFRDGKRPATVMHQIAKGYSEQQIDMIAEHFARLSAR